MTFTYEDFYVSGFNTGAGIVSGVQTQTPIYCIITGLKYDGVPITTSHFSHITGTFIAGSGDLTEFTGSMGFDVPNDYMIGALYITGSSGLFATGCVELFWNSGVVTDDTGFKVDGYGFELFGNFNKDAWDMLTFKDGSIESADSQHSHATSAQHLYDLDDVFIPGSIPDGNALIYFAASGGWTTGLGGEPDDWTAVSGEVAEITGTVFDYAETSGAVADYPETSGAVADYPAVSGIVAIHVLDDNAHHEVIEQGDVDTSITTHKNDDNAHHEVIEQGDVDTSISTHTSDDDAHHAIPTAYDFEHNSLAGLNDGVDYEHITQDQKDALHAAIVAGDLSHNDLADIDADDIKHITAAQLGALHTAVTEVYNLKATDDRDYKPNTSATWRFIKAYFTTLGGMTGADDSDYQDLLILNTYSDGSGGDMNALTFDKSTKLIKHWLADQGAATWGSPEILAYISNITTHTADDDAHHAATVAGDLNLNDLNEKSHDNLDDVSIDDHHDRDHDNDEHSTNYAAETRVFEQSAAFPGAPDEGDFHYDEDDDTLFRYNGEAEAWIEVGVGGGKGISFEPPIGFITMFSGAWTDNVTILGWFKCDGSNGTPNLVNKFIRGAATSGGSGGSDDAIAVTHSHNHGHNHTHGTSGSHVHQMTDIWYGANGNHQYGLGTVGLYRGNQNTDGDGGHLHSADNTLDNTSAGASGTNKNIPAYYALIFIMRVN